MVVREEDLDRASAQRRLAPSSGLREAGLVRWVCQSPAEAIRLVNRLQAAGLRDPSYSADDIAVADEARGLLAPCPWLDVTGSASTGWHLSLREPG